MNVSFFMLWKRQLLPIRWLFAIQMLFFAHSSIVQAQIQAPDLLCIFNDTLRWEVPTNTCGPFQNYTIYTATNRNGPYTLLATITNATQRSFFHENAGVGLRFYYMQSNFNCPGQPVLSSDTLNNRIPEMGRIRSVSVIGEDVEIRWEPSPSPQTFAYVISKNTATGTTVIDTVFGTTTYLDTNAQPNERQETYFVVALDRCGNVSLVPPPHRTILLRTEGASACDRTVRLTWNLYQNWSQAIERHEIWVRENGGEPRRVGETAGNVSAYTFLNASANVQYCFSVRAIESGTGNRAVSNESCLTLDVIQGVNELVAVQASVNADNRVLLTWLWNTDAQLRENQILRSENGTIFTALRREMPAMPLSRENTFMDESALPAQRVMSYRLETTDACNEKVRSNIVATIRLEVQSTGMPGVNRLRWSEYINEYVTGNINYEVYRSAGNNPPTLIATYGDGNNEHTDELDLDNPEEANVCYFIIAKAALRLPNGNSQPVESRSNSACADQRAQLFVPNAFAPNGLNREFKPVLQFGQPMDYTMIIYDRWGGKIFESRSIEIGWDGRGPSGRELPLGAYTYHIRLTQSNNQRIDQAGVVLLIR